MQQGLSDVILIKEIFIKLKTYKVQEEAKGIAHALLLVEDFANKNIQEGRR